MPDLLPLLFVPFSSASLSPDCFEHVLSFKSFYLSKSSKITLNSCSGICLSSRAFEILHPFKKLENSLMLYFNIHMFSLFLFSIHTLILVLSHSEKLVTLRKGCHDQKSLVTDVKTKLPYMQQAIAKLHIMSA